MSISQNTERSKDNNISNSVLKNLITYFVPFGSILYVFLSFFYLIAANSAYGFNFTNSLYHSVSTANYVFAFLEFIFLFVLAVSLAKKDDIYIKVMRNFKLSAIITSFTSFPIFFYVGMIFNFIPFETVGFYGNSLFLITINILLLALTYQTVNSFLLIMIKTLKVLKNRKNIIE